MPIQITIKTLKPLQPHAFSALLMCLAALLIQFVAPAAFAAGPFYWDNVAGAGFGAAGGTWAAPTAGPIPGWNTDSTGTIAPSSVTTATTDTSENFGTASAGLTTGAVTVSGAVSSGNIVFGAASGTITLSGGTSITLPGAATITVNNTKDIISTPLAGSAGNLTVTGGTLVVSNTALPATTYNIASGATLELNAPTVNPLANATIFTNTGTLKFSGGATATIIFGAAGNDVVQLSAGGLVQVSSNTTVTGSSGYHGIWNNNLGSLTVDSGSTINFVETGGSTAGTQAQFDALNGGGTISMGYLTYRTLSIGNANGSGSFSGSLKDAGSPAVLALLKNGTGTQILSGSSTYTGGTTISNGVLEADSNTALGTGAVTMSGGTLSNNVSSTLANAVIVSSAATIGIGVGSGKTLTLGGVVSSSGPLTKTGAGTLILTGANTYSGQTTISVGELDFLTSSASGSAVNITSSAGATNGIIVTSPGGQWVNTGNLTNQTSSVFHVNYSSFSPSTTIAPMSVGNLSLGSTLILRVDGSSSVFFAGQSYPLVTWTTSGPANATGFTTLVLPTGVSGNLSVSGSTLYLNVTANTSQLTWNTGNGNWDIATANWLSNGIAAKYVDTTSSVVFDDATSASGNPVVTLAANYTPQGVLMKSTSHNYFIASGNAIAGSTSLILDPANTQTLTLSNANTYTGGTTIGGGTLAIAGAGSLGSGSYAGAIANNGNLNLGSSAGQTLSGIISGTGALNYSGSGGLTLNAVNSYSGGTTIANSAVNPKNGFCFGTGTVTVNTNGQVYNGQNPGLTLTFTNAVALNGGTLHTAGGQYASRNTWSGPVTLTASSAMSSDGGTLGNLLTGGLNMGNSGYTLTVNGNGPNDGFNANNFNSVISGGSNATFQVLSAGIAYLNAANTFSGTVRSGYSVVLQNVNALQNATLDMNAADSGSVTLINNAVIGGLMGSRNLTVGGNAVSIGNNGTSTTYSGSLGGTGNITKLGTGTLNLSGTNNFTGELIFNNGIVNVSSLATYATEAVSGSPLGGRTLAQDTGVSAALHFTGGTLQYTNTGLGAQTTDRYIRVLGGAGIAATIDASGLTSADTIAFTQSGANYNFWDGAGNRSVQLTGSNTGNNVFALNIPDYNNGSSKVTLIKNGSGTWDVTNPHNSDAGTTANNAYGGYTGGTVLYGGILGFASGALGASGTIVFSNNATLGWDNANSQDLSSRLKISDGVTATIAPGTNNVTFASALLVGSVGSGALTKLNSGTLTLTAVNTFSGATTISAGTLAIGGAGSLGSGSYAAAITNNGTSTFNSSASQTLTGIISGAGSINALGSGNFRMDGANTYSGGTTVGNCSVLLWKNPANNAAFGTGSVTVNNATLYGAFGNFTITNSLTLNGASLHTGGGSGSLSFSGPVTLGTNGVFMGGDGGTAPIILSGNVTFGTNTIISSYGTGESYIGTINGSITGSGGVLLTTNTGFANLTFNGAVNGPFSLYHNGINNGTLVLGAANTFSGTARAQSGTLYIANALGLQNATLDMNATDSGGVTLAASSPTLGALMGVRNLSLPSGTTAIGNNNSNTVYGGALIGSGSISKIGSGVLTLSGTNGYAGATTFSVGTLALGTNQVLPTATTVNLNGGTLDMSTFSNIVSGIKIAGITKARGTWGASGSGANHISASIIGTGILTVTNGGASTSVVTSSANPSTYGSVTFTNTVTGSNGDGSAPNGTVTFYDGATPIGSGTLASSSGTVSTYTFTINSLAVDTHSITASYAGNASYDVSTSSVLSQVVNRATSTATVTVNNSPVTYDGSGHAATVTLSGTNTPGSVTVILTGGAATQTAVGTYAVTATFVPANTNYTTLAGLSAGNFTITQAPGTSFSNLSSVTNRYGMTNIVLTGTMSATGPVYPAIGELVSATINGVITVNGTITDGTGDFSINTNSLSLGTNGVAGSPYAITYNYAGNLAAASDTSTTLTVTNAPLTITANNDSKVYGSIGSSYGVGLTNFTSTGLENGETIGTVTITAGDTPSGTEAADPAGNYDLTPSAATGGTFNPTNYLTTYVNGTLTNSPLAIAVTADAQTKVYGTSDPALTYSYLPVLIVGDSFSGALSRASGENVGSYAIGQNTLNLSTNYTLNYTGTNLVITPAALAITANNTTKNYGQTVTFAGTEFTAGGLHFSDSVTSVTLASTGATNTAAVGSYPIVISAATGTGLGNRLHKRDFDGQSSQHFCRGVLH